MKFYYENGVKYRDVIISDEQRREIDKFAADMSTGGLGQHRDHRSGGRLVRDANEIHDDVVTGKIGEFAVYNFLIDAGVEVLSEPNLDVYGLTIWDVGTDLSIRTPEGKIWQVDVKSTQYYSKNLMLESDNWRIDSSNNLIRYGTETADIPDYWIGVNVDPEINKARIYGYLSKGKLKREVREVHGEHFWAKDSPIPGTSGNVLLDANNYIWSYKGGDDFKKIDTFIWMYNQH